MSDVIAKYIFSDCRPLVMSGSAPVAVSVTQTVHGANNEPLLGAQVNTGIGGSVTFAIEGPRYSLDLHDVAGVYPAPDSRESPADFVPHIAIRRRTLPWERVGPLGPAGGAPWVALLLLNSQEFVTEGAPANASMASIRSTTIKSLAPTDPLYVALHQGGGTVDDTAELRLLVVPNKLLSAILPDPGDLGLLCHMKRTTRLEVVKSPGGTFTSENVNDDTAIVISNRLPNLTMSGADPILHFAFLVSLENRADIFKLDPAKSTSLIVLHQWKFTPSGSGDFEDVMQSIRYGEHGGVLRFGNLPDSPMRSRVGPLHNSFASALDETGYFITPLVHTQDGKANYRGPLLPFVAPPRSPGFAIRAAPEEFEVAPPGTPLDYSNATAFEVGRLMAISDSGLMEDLESIRRVWKFPIQQYVAMSKLPLALERPDWVVDPEFAGLDRYTVASLRGKTLVSTSLTADSEIAAHATADFTGIAALQTQWDNKPSDSPISLAAQPLNILTVTPDSAANLFPEAVNVTKRSG